MLYRKGQIGETTTWVVATIVIFFVVFLFLYLVGIIDNFTIESEKFKGELSGIAGKEMLFAVLSRDVEGRSVLELIKSEEFGLARGSVEDSLSVFSQDGFTCDFYVVGFPLKVENGGLGEEIILNVDGKEVVLRC